MGFVTTLKIVLNESISNQTCSMILGLAFIVQADLLLEPRWHKCQILDPSHMQDFKFNDTSHIRIFY